MGGQYTPVHTMLMYIVKRVCIFHLILVAPSRFVCSVKNRGLINGQNLSSIAKVVC